MANALRLTDRPRVMTALSQPGFTRGVVFEYVDMTGVARGNASRSFEFNNSNRNESRYNNAQLQARMNGATITSNLALTDDIYVGRVVHYYEAGTNLRKVVKDGVVVGSGTGANPESVYSLSIGDRRTLASRPWNGDIMDWRASSKRITEAQAIALSLGDMSIMDDAEVIYNNFTQEEADNGVIENKGTLSGSWDLNATQGWSIIDPYEEEVEIPAPTITITNKNPESYQSQPFGYLNGVIATDYLGNDITGRITTTANGAPITSPLQFAGLTPSTYTLIYSVEDDFNNTTVETITLTILPVPNPTLTISNYNPEIFSGDPYNYLDGVSAEDFFGTPLTVRVNVGSDNISDPSYFASLSEGQYTIAYNAIDSLYNFTQELATLTVSASPAPIITAPVSSTIQRGESFAYLNGVSATDFEGNDLTLAIETTVDGQVITNPNYFATLLSGSYTISYSVRDRLNQITNRTQTLTINRNPAPTLTVFDRTPQITLGESFAYLGNVEAEDFEGNDLTGNIFTLIDGDLFFEPTFTPDKAGTYTILYTVDDRYGEFAQETIALTVMEPIVITKPSIRFDGTNSGFTDFNQQSFDVNTVYMEVDFNVSNGAQQVYFNTHVADNGMLSQAGGVEINSFGTDGVASSYGRIPDGYKKIVLQWDASTSRYRMYVDGQLYTGINPITRWDMSRITLGRFGTGGRNAVMNLFDIRFSSIPISNAEVGQIFLGDTTSIDDADIIYNNFTEEERDNNLIKNRGFLKDFYDLTSSNLIFENPLPAVEPPKEGVLVGDNYLIYKANPKHISLESDSILQVYGLSSFNLDVMKFSFKYRRPAQATGRLISLAVENSADTEDANMIRLTNNNRLMIQPNGPVNDQGIRAQTIGATTFRFQEDTYYTMVVKYDTSINNYKVWINGELIDMGYAVGEENQRMMTYGFAIGNRKQDLSRGSNLEFYNVSFENSQLDDEECLRLSTEFTEILNTYNYKASDAYIDSVTGRITIQEKGTRGSSYIGGRDSGSIVEDELKPLSCIVGDGRVIIPLPSAKEEWILTTDGGVVDLSVLPQGDYSIIATNNSGPAPFGALSAPGYGTRQSSRAETTFLVDRAFIGVEDSTLTAGAQMTKLCIREGKHFFTTEYLSNNSLNSEPYLQSAVKDGLLTGAFASGWTIRAKRLSNFDREEVYDGGQDIDISHLPIGEYSIIARKTEGPDSASAVGVSNYTFSSANSSLTNRVASYDPLIPIVNSTANTAGTATLSIRTRAHAITNEFITDSLFYSQRSYIYGFKNDKLIQGVPSGYEIVIRPKMAIDDPDLIRITSVNNRFDISGLENGDYVIGYLRSSATSLTSSVARGASGRAIFASTATSSTSGRFPIINSTSQDVKLAKLCVRDGITILRAYEFNNTSGIFMYDTVIEGSFGVDYSLGHEMILKKISA